MLQIKGHDSSTIEASILGIFEGSQDLGAAAWRETLKIQNEKDISNSADLRLIALILFASRFKYNLASSHVEKIEDVLRDRLRNALNDSGFFAQSLWEVIKQKCAI